MPAGRVRQVAAYYKCIYIRVILGCRGNGSLMAGDHCLQVVTRTSWTIIIYIYV